MTKYHRRLLRVTEASDDDVIMLSTAVRRTIGVFGFSELAQHRGEGGCSPATDWKSFQEFSYFFILFLPIRGLHWLQPPAAYACESD